MKRSEVIADLKSGKASPLSPGDAWWELVADYFEHTVGVRYDPEEPELPERLEFFLGAGTPGFVTARAGGLASSVLTTVGRYRLGDDQAAQVLREAVRRWNAWPGLRHIASDVLDINEDIGERLLAILDGREASP